MKSYVLFLCVYSYSEYRMGLQFDYENVITYDMAMEDNEIMKNK